MTDKPNVTQAPFGREDRYIVIKRKHLEADVAVHLLADLKYAYGVEPVASVVVEADWPEYERVWRMIEDRASGRTAYSGDGRSDWAEEDVTNGQFEADDFGPVADLARHIASHCEGEARKNVYRVAKGVLSASQGEVGRPDAEEDDRSWLGTSIDRIDAMEEAAQLREVVSGFVRLERPIKIDIGSAHSLRGPAASSAMREDDRDFRRELEALFDSARAALAQPEAR